MTIPRVRPATIEDAHAIARVHMQAWRAAVWVAESDGVIGFAGTGGGDHAERPRPLELGAIYVLAEYHGTGAGQAPLDAAIGDEPAFLFVARGNPRAIRFYERNGFVFDGASESYPLVRTPITSLRMVR